MFRLQLTARHAIHSQACLKGKKKKTWGGTKTCNVKKGLCGGRKKAPIPDKKALDAVRPWALVTHWLTKQAVKNPQKEGTNPPPSRGFPWPSLGRGAGETTLA